MFLSTFEADRARIDAAVADERAAHASGKSADDLRSALEGLQTEVLHAERRVAEAGGRPLIFMYCIHQTY